MLRIWAVRTERNPMITDNISPGIGPSKTYILYVLQSNNLKNMILKVFIVFCADYKYFKAPEADGVKGGGSKKREK